MKPILLAASALLSAFGVASSATAQETLAVPQPVVDESGHILDFGEGDGERMTVAVNIGASGPHLFIVDTGAERTVISRELARSLDLGPGLPATMHSMTEVSTVSTVIIPELQVGGKSVLRINAPALERRNLGAEGLLGVDTLQSQRVLFDFAKQEMTVTPSRKREPKWPSDTIVITAKSRFGYLVLVDASVDGQRVWVIIDTGSEATVANNELRRRLERKGRLKTTIPVELTSVTGRTTVADQGLARRIRIGGIEVENLPVVFTDAHPFRKLGLMDRPAILLGMDALQLFKRVSVDFANRVVKIWPGDTSWLQPTTRIAGLDAKTNDRPALR